MSDENIELLTVENKRYDEFEVRDKYIKIPDSHNSGASEFLMGVSATMKRLWKPIDQNTDFNVSKISNVKIADQNNRFIETVQN